MKKRVLALLCACLLACCQPALAVTRKPAAAFTEGDGSYTLQCPDGWLACNWEDTLTLMDTLQDEPFYTLLNYFMFYQGLMDSPTYLFKNGEPAVISLMLTSNGQSITDEALAADFARTLDWFSVYEAFTPSQPEAAAPAQDKNGVRWLERGFTFTDSGSQWEAVCLLGVKGKLLIRLSMLAPKATAQKDRQALNAVKTTLALKPGRENAGIAFKTLYGQFRIDDDKTVCYQNGHNGYVDVGECLIYAVPLDWIALFDRNLEEELAAVSAMDASQANAYTSLVRELYASYSATLLTPDRKGVLVSLYLDLDPMKTWKSQAKQLIVELSDGLRGAPGFQRMVASPDSGSAQPPETLVYEYVVNVYGQSWRVLLGFIRYGAYLPGVFLYVPEGALSDALRAEFSNTLRSMQAGIAVEP